MSRELLQYAFGPMVFLGGGAVSYERGTPLLTMPRVQDAGVLFTVNAKVYHER